MITPESRDDAPRKRRIALFSTAGIVALAAVLVAWVNIPDFTSPRNTYREINPAQLSQVQPQPEREPEPTQEEETPEENEEPETEKTPERIEAPDLQTDALQAEPTSSQTTPSSEESPSSSESGGSENNVGVERTEIGGIDETEASDPGAAGALPSATDQSTSGESNGGGIAIEEGSGGGQGSTGSDFAGGETVAAGGGTDAPEGDSLQKITLSQAAEEEDAGNLEVSKLIQWMRENPAQLPGGIKQLVGYQPNYLSSKIMSMDEGNYEMYLMCKESLREVHIVLVQGERAQYLVDRSFQKQSQKFRAGPVRRSGGAIVGVKSESKPRDEEAQRFYDVFLSWWKEAKTDVQN